MNVYTTEEEQLETLKRWWKENGTSIIVGIILAVAAVFGWRAWQSHQYTQGELTSGLYSDLIDAVQVSQNNGSEESLATVAHLAGRLKTEFDSNVYGRYAALLLAKQAVENNELEAAQQELQWVLDRTDARDSLRAIVELRMARLLLAMGGDDNARKALALLQASDVLGYKASRAEVRGDLYLSLGQLDEARGAYSEALAEVERLGASKPLLQMKLDDLAEAESKE